MSLAFLRPLHGWLGALLALCAGCALQPAQPPVAMSCVQPRCEGAADPLGVDVPRPSLGWQIQSAQLGQIQTAYEVIVGSTAAGVDQGHGDLWDSGPVQSDLTTVSYGGAPLASFRAVYWKVRAWGRNGAVSPWSDRAEWTMGVMPGERWTAAWITDPELLRQRRNALGFHSQDTKNPDTTKWLQLDWGSSQPVDQVILQGLRFGVVEGLGFPRRFKVEISSDAGFTHPAVIADYSAADFPNRWITRLTLPAHGAVGRYLRLTATRLRVEEGLACLAMSRVEVRSGGRGIDVGARVTASDSIETAPWSAAALADGLGGRRANPRANTTLRLRREFTVRPGLKRALIVLCGLGDYHLTFDGGRVGDAVMSPGWTEYSKTCLYDEYDVTSRLAAGAHAVGLELAGGMYDVEDGRYTKFVTPVRPLTAIASLRLEYADGTVETVETDDQWRLAPGPITFSSVYGGEDYDARQERAGWDSPGFDASSWHPAVRWEGPGGALTGLCFAAPPVRAFAPFAPVKTTVIRPGVTVYDFGQNAAMMLRLSVQGAAGASIRLIPAELLAADGTVDTHSGGGPGSWWNYTLSGRGTETWTPDFFYHGCRYVQAETTPAPGAAAAARPTIATIATVLVHSDSPPVGQFSCSNELFNRIHELVRWAQLSNQMSVLTDCPTRERLGWLEEDHLNGPALRYEFGLNRLFGKISHDMADAQRADGLVPDIAPEYLRFTGDFRDSPEWGSASVLMPWQQYEWTGDLEGLRRAAPTMRRYVDYLGSRASGHLLSYGLGDWYDLGAGPPGPAQLTPPGLTATAFYCDDVSILARVSELLGNADDARRYQELAAAIRTAFNRAYFDPVRERYATGSQCAEAIPLVMNLVPTGHRAGVLAALVADLAAHDNGLTAGDVGYRYLLRALADGGRSDLVAAMISRSDRPGYAYQLGRGATSLTEAWNASPRSSQDHFMLGQINEWFYHDLAGIQLDPTRPGYRHIVIRPAVVSGVAWTKARYDSVNGPIACAWERSGPKLTVRVEIPANTEATIDLPGRPAFTTGSGSYVFSSELPAAAQ